MKIARVIGMVAMVGAVVLLAGCDWSVTVRKKVGQPAEGEITIKGGGSPTLMSVSRMTISATDIYVDTTGTDFALASSGMASLTVSDSSGTILGANAFAWVKTGSHLVFQNPAAVQSWLNQYPTAAGVDTKITYGNTPADGVDHVMTTAVVYQGVTQAAQTATFPAECMTRYNTRALCMQ